MARMTVDNSKVLTRFKEKSPKGRKTLRLDVGYEAPYAVYVHENLEANHPNGGQAKFLETVVRGQRKEIGRIIRTALKNKEGLQVALERAGRFILAQSRPLVPVDTGFLRDSGYVRVG